MRTIRNFWTASSSAWRRANAFAVSGRPRYSSNGCCLQFCQQRRFPLFRTSTGMAGAASANDGAGRKFVRTSYKSWWNEIGDPRSPSSDRSVPPTLPLLSPLPPPRRPTQREGEGGAIHQFHLGFARPSRGMALRTPPRPCLARQERPVLPTLPFSFSTASFYSSSFYSKAKDR
jgi:hypothetical protein